MRKAATAAGVVTVLLLAGAGSGVAQTPSPPVAPLRLALPGEAWILELPAPGFAIAQLERPASGGQRYILAVDRRAGATLSILLDRIPQATSAAACRNHYWTALQARTPLAMEEIRVSPPGDPVMVEYMVRTVRDIRIDQKHVNLYLARGGACVDVHLSKVRFSPTEDAYLRGLLGSVRLVERGSAPAAPEWQRYTVSDKAGMALEVPAGWEAIFPIPARGNLPTVTFATGSPSPASVQVSFLTGQDLGADPPAALRFVAERFGKPRLATAEETTPVLEELGGGGPGYYYRLTDKAPKLGEYRHLLQGVAAVGPIVVTFTVLTHGPDAPDIAAALSMLRGARPD
jgi:hypothetical protein